MADKVLCFLLLATILELLEGGARGNLINLIRKKRIIFGDDAKINEMPYMAMLRQKSGFVPICGGTIITPSDILTAAHCFWSPPEPETGGKNGTWDNPCGFEFVLGTANSHGTGGQLYQLEEVYFPHDFNLKTLQSDIAVAKLHGVILFDYSTVAPARLPFREVKYNVKALIGGWGVTRLEKIPQNLQKLEVTTVERSSCHEEYGVSILKRDDSMCAHKYHNIDFGGCKGDSGGGLVKDDLVFGVMSSSFDKDCGLNVDEYTIVGHHLEWILLVLFDQIPADMCVLSRLHKQSFG